MILDLALNRAVNCWILDNLRERCVTKSKSIDMLNDPINQTLKSMTIPVVFSMILLLSFGMVDTFFVGLLGTEQLAAISFTFPVTFTIISLNIGLSIGTSATVARFVGSKQTDNAQLVGNGALALAVVFSLSLSLIGWRYIDPIFSALGATSVQMPYIRDYMVLWFASSVFLAIPMVGNSILRANGDTKTPSVVLSLCGFINALLDPVFIFGLGPIPAMGIQGAALATIIAWAIGTFYVLALLIQRHLILPRFLRFSELGDACSDVLKIAIPAVGSNMLTPIANGVMTSIIAQYGSAAVASWGVGGRLESIATIVVLSLSMTLSPFISQNYGADKIHRVKEAYINTMRFVVIWQAVVYGLVYLGAPLIAMAFAQDGEVEKMIMLYLSIVPLSYGLQGVVILTNSSLNAMHKPMGALTLSVMRFFVFFVPISYLGSVFFGLIGIFWGGVVAYLGMGVVSYVCYRRLLNSHALVKKTVIQEGA